MRNIEISQNLKNKHILIENSPLLLLAYTFLLLATQPLPTWFMPVWFTYRLHSRVSNTGREDTKYFPLPITTSASLGAKDKGNQLKR